MMVQIPRLGFGVTAWARGARLGYLDGIGIYTRALYQVFQSREQSTELMPFAFGQPTSLPFGTPQILARRVSFHLAAAALLKQRLSCPADLFHATDHHIPRLDIPVVATVMDLIPFLYPEWVSGGLRPLKNWLFKQSILSAEHIITISEHSRQDLMTHFNIPSARISVTPLGVDARYFQAVSAEKRLQVLEKYHLNSGFFLFIGTLQPRKNIATVLDAHALLPRALQKKHPMVIVGRVGWGVDTLIPRLQQLERQGVVRWLNYVAEVDVMVLLQSACALTFLSLYEGFGLPILEAFAARCPVIASNTTSIPEVAQDAALLVNPLDIMQIREALLQGIEDRDLMNRLEEKGYQRARLFTWEACADATWQAYERALSH